MMKINGEGIYNTTAVAPYSEGNIYYTKAKNGAAMYAFVLADKDEADLPETINLTTGTAKVKGVTLLGSGRHLKWTNNGDKIVVTMPKGVALKYAAGVRIDY